MNPFVGVIYHWIGGLAAASFYIPYKGVKRWSWETYWLVGGVFSWIIAPALLVWLLVPGFESAIAGTPAKNLLWAFGFGVVWGVGGLTFGLTMRYLGVALGMAVALGLCAVFGTLIPPIFSGEFSNLLTAASGRFILVGVAVCIVGIAVNGAAGISKERELSQEQKQGTIAEFNLGRGVLLAVVCGVLSAMFAYGLAAGKPLAEATAKILAAQGRSDLWQNLPVLVIVLWGGFVTNFTWCLVLGARNRSFSEYLPATARRQGVPYLANFMLCAVAGVTWYLQFFFYSMGQTRMGRYEFSSWTLHMASIIIFGSIWGIALKEWKGTSPRTRALVFSGIALLIGSTLFVGYGNFLSSGGVAP